MIHVIIFKIKQWYARAKTEYNENLQTLREKKMRKHDALFDTLQRENPTYTTRTVYEEIREKIENEEISGK